MEESYRSFRNLNRENMNLLSGIQAKLKALKEKMREESDSQNKESADKANNIQKLEKTKRLFESMGELKKVDSLATVEELREKLLPRFKYLNFESFLAMKRHELINHSLANPMSIPAELRNEDLCVLLALKVFYLRQSIKPSEFRNDPLMFHLRKIDIANQTKALLNQICAKPNENAYVRVSPAASNLMFVYPFEFLQHHLFKGTNDSLLLFLVLNLFESDLANYYRFSSDQIAQLQESLELCKRIGKFMNESSRSKPVPKKSRRNKFLHYELFLAALLSAIKKRNS